jgi:hypothetical protein
MVKKAGELAGVNLRPHDLRRHAATPASRSGTPIEIISKVILRHAHLLHIPDDSGRRFRTKPATHSD